MKIQDLMNFEPQLPGYEHAGPEPSLSTLIYEYYREHFTPEESINSTNEYIEQLEKQYYTGENNASERN